LTANTAAIQIVLFLTKPSSGYSCKWWHGIRDICEDTTGYDPIAEILKLSNEYIKPNKRRETGTRNNVGRPKVLEDEEEVQRRRDLKDAWEQAHEAKISKTDFCRDEGIEPEYLNNSVLRYCRDHSL